MNPADRLDRVGDARSALAVAALVTVVVAAVGPAALAATDPNYSVRIDGAVAVPTVEYTTDGETVEVTGIGRYTSQDSLQFSVDAPAGEYYTVRIVDGDQTVVETEAGRGDDEFSVPLRYYDVGTYVVAVTDESGDQRELLAAQPFVVSGYTVDQSSPRQVDPGETFTVTATVEERGNPPSFTDVTIAVGDGSTRVVHNATRINDTAWTATFDASTFGTGTLTVVTGVRGGPAFNGTTRELLGMSASDTVSVREATPTSTPTPTATATVTASSTATTPTSTTSAASSTATATASSTATTPTTATSAATATDVPPTTTTAGTATSAPPTTGPTAATSTEAGGDEPTVSPAVETTTPSDSNATAADVTTQGGTGGTGDGDGDGGSTATSAPLFGPLGHLLLLVAGLCLLAVRDR